MNVRILIVGLNYLPESTSIGPYTADLAEYLAGRGHQVQVVTGFPMAPQWRVWDGYRRKILQKEVINNIPVQRTFLYVPRRPGRAINRILFDVSFAISSFFGAMLTGIGYQIIIVISPPLQIGITGWLLSKLNRAPLFLHLQDLVPDAAIATGMLSKDSRAAKLAYAMERFVYGHASRIGVISEGFRDNLVRKGIAPDRIRLFPNYIDLDFVVPVEHDNSFRSEHGIDPDHFVVMYSGSIALKQGLHTLVEAAVLLRDYRQIVFFIIGEGPHLEDLKARALDSSLANLHFLPLQPRESLSQQLSAANVLVITQKQAVTDVVFPGKLLYYMGAGRPILGAVSPESETGRFIARHQIGVVVPPEQPERLAEAIVRLYQEGTGILGLNARRTAETLFDRHIVLRQFADYLESL